MTQGAEYKARREALGWDTERAAEATCPFWQDVRSGESVAAHEIEMIESGYANFVETFPAAYDAALTAEETRRREVGAKLRARREGLGMSNMGVIERSSGKLRPGNVNAIEEGRGEGHFDARVAAYAAVLDEAEARRALRDEARRVLAQDDGFGDFSREHLPELHRQWLDEELDSTAEAVAYAAIKAEVAKLAEEPEPTPIVADPSPVAIHAPNGTRLRIGEVTPTTVVIHVEPEPAADPDPMPEPPEGVTVIHATHAAVSAATTRGGTTTHTHVFAHSLLVDEYLVERLKWEQRQHTRTQEAAAEAERARLLDAVRDAKLEEGAAWAAKDAAWAAYNAASDRHTQAVGVLDAARKAAGL